MKFRSETFYKLLPPYLTSIEKGRLESSLSQFHSVDIGTKDINYSSFYAENAPEYLMQGDILHSVKIVDWDDETSDYYSGFSSAMIISNTCDLSTENKRSVNIKQSLVAPVLSLREYFEDLKLAGYSKDQINGCHQVLKQQGYSNLLYLPPKLGSTEDFVVFLDKLVWHPTKSLSQQLTNLEHNRHSTLSLFGFYLLVLKISYHLSRLPEEGDRA